MSNYPKNKNKIKTYPNNHFPKSKNTVTNYCSKSIKIFSWYYFLNFILITFYHPFLLVLIYCSYYHFNIRILLLFKKKRDQDIFHVLFLTPVSTIFKIPKHSNLSSTGDSMPNGQKLFLSKTKKRQQSDKIFVNIHTVFSTFKFIEFVSHQKGKKNCMH